MAQEIADSKLIDTWGSGGLKVEPDVSKIIEGWQFGEQPPHEYMNWLQNTFGSKLNHILKNGVAKWDGETEYLAGSSVQHSGNVWICETTNTNSEPTNLNANWEKVAINKDLTVTVDTIADLRSISYPANTVWASGYHTKNDGAFGSHIFRLKGVKTTETDNSGTVIIATIGGTDYVYELQYDGAVNVKWFGAKGDGVTDDGLNIAMAINASNNVEGAGQNYLVSGTHTVNKIDDFTLSNFNFSCTAKDTLEFSLNIISQKNVTVENISYDGNSPTKYNNDTKWFEQVGGQIYGRSVWPIASSILSVTSKDAVFNGITFRNVHVGECIRTANTGSLFASNLSFTNTTFCTIVATGDSAEIKTITNYTSTDNGLLPSTFLVKEIGTNDYTTVANREDRIFFNQGAFGARLMNYGNYIVNNFIAINYASSALVSDINRSFVGTNIRIESTDNRYISNNTTAAIYSELTKDIKLSHITLDIQDRNTDDYSTWGIYFYQGDNTYTARLSDFHISCGNGGFMEDCIHSVHNYGGNVYISNGSVLSSGNRAYSTRINFNDGYSGATDISNVIVSGTAGLYAHDATEVKMTSVKTDGNIYIGNFAAGGVTKDINLDKCNCDSLTISAIEDKLKISNTECNTMTQTEINRNEIVTNGFFADTSSWTSTTGTFTVSSGQATLVNGGIYQTISGLIPGSEYSVQVFNNRSASTYNGDIRIMSGTAGDGAILASNSSMSSTSIYVLTFVATSSSHSVALLNYTNSNTLVYGGISIKPIGALRIDLDNLTVKKSTSFNLYASGHGSYLNMSRCKVLGGGAKNLPANYCDNVSVENCTFYSTSTGASTTCKSNMTTHFVNNRVIKGVGDEESTYSQFTTRYSYAFSPVNVNNTNVRSVL